MGWIQDDGNFPPDAPSILPAGGAGGDVEILWDNIQAIGDWAYASGDLLTGQDLETACLTSLFSDRVATPDFVPTDGTSDRRGWWADTYLDEPLGSNLWQLDRAKTLRATLGLARGWTVAALQWLVDDGVAKAIACNAVWLNPNMLGIGVLITQPDGTQTRFMFGWAWDNLAHMTSPLPWPPDASSLAPLSQRRRRVAVR